MFATLVGLTGPIAWSLIPLLTYYIKHLDPVLVMSVVFLMFFAIDLLRQIISRSLINPLKHPLSFYIIGIIGIFGFHIFYFSALRLAPIMPVYLIVNTTSICIIIYSKILHNIEIRPNHILAFIINFSAICLIAVSKASEEFSSHHLIGYGMAFLAANCWAFYSAKNRDFDAPISATSYVILFSGILSLIAYEIFSDFTLINISNDDLILLLLLALWPVGYSLYFWAYGVRHGDIRILAAIAFINPVLGSIWLILAGIEEFSWVILISLILILTGSFIARSK